MGAKDKKKKIKINLKNIIFTCFVIIILFDIVIFYNLYLKGNVSYAVSSNNVENEKLDSSEEEVNYSNVNTINIDEIINQNSSQSTSEGLRQEDVVLEYLTEYVQTDELAKGESYVVQEGAKGTQRITYKKVYENGKLTGEEQVSAVVVKPAFNKIIKIGTGIQKKLSEANVGDTVNVTSDELTIRGEPNEESSKIAKAKNGESLQILKIQGNWYYVSYKSFQGWVDKESTKFDYVEPEQKNESNSVSLSGKNVKNLTFDMQLNKPSGLSLEEFQKVLKDDKDVNKIFEQNAQYFYYVEKQYNINGLFVAAIGIHESNWGTSKIAKDKKNLFGYGAYDSNPYNGAYQFSQYSESIDLISRVLVKYYLNPKGTSIYSGEKAIGTYYTSSTLSGVNNKYASDKNWANTVYKHMQYLYGKL